MTNAVTPFGGGAVVDPDSLRAGLQKYKQEAPPVIDGATLLRLTNDGEFVFGAENADVEEGSIWAINPYSITHGLVSWTDHPQGKKNELVGEVMVPFSQTAPAVEEMRDTGWPWKRQTAMDLLCVTGGDKGTQVSYRVTSIGGLRAQDEFIAKLLQQLDKDPAQCVALITLDVGSYFNKKYSRTISFPIIEIDSWASMEDNLLELFEEEAEPEKPKAKPKAAKPKVTGGRKARSVKAEEPAAEPEAEAEETATEEAPPPRRRRRG